MYNFNARRLRRKSDDNINGEAQFTCVSESWGCHLKTYNLNKKISGDEGEFQNMRTLGFIVKISSVWSVASRLSRSVTGIDMNAEETLPTEVEPVSRDKRSLHINVAQV
jgi:hypothetical protein